GEEGGGGGGGDGGAGGGVRHHRAIPPRGLADRRRLQVAGRRGTARDDQDAVRQPHGGAGSAHRGGPGQGRRGGAGHAVRRQRISGGAGDLRLRHGREDPPEGPLGRASRGPRAPA